VGVSPAAQQTYTLLDEVLAAAVTAEIRPAAGAVAVGGRAESLLLYCEFVRAGGGTTAKAWVQTTFNDGVSWVDIASFAFTTTDAIRAYHLTAAAVTSIATPTDGTLADNTSVNGLLGAQFRVKITTTGTYTGASSFKIWAMPT
jgi:hypothetical protein